MLKILTVVIFGLAISSSSFAFVSDVEVTGTLVSYNKEIAVIKTAHGKTKVPRYSLPDLRGYIAGKAHVTAHVLPSDLARLNFYKNVKR